MSGYFSKRAGGHLHLGKLAPKPLRDAMAFSQAKAFYVKAGGELPPMPEHFGYGGDFSGGPIAQGGWGMLGNGPCDDGSINPDWAAYGGAGDCAFAGPAHETMADARNAGVSVPPFTCLSVLECYSAFGGYDLQSGANDGGAAIADVLSLRQDKGLPDANGTAHKIGKSFEGTPGDLQQCWEMCFLLEKAGLGIVVSEANMQQFDDGKEWDWDAGSPQIGGHYICAVGRASEGDTGVITWAHRHGFTRAFFAHQNDELVGYLSLEMYNRRTGEDAQGYAEVDVERYFTALAHATS
jgi:hypothetical protein